MTTIGAILSRVAPGEVTIDLPFRHELTQQHGLLHAGIATSVMDTACGYAALTLMERGAAVLTIEFKVNLVAPARGHRFRASARVVRAGRNITVVSGEFRVLDAGGTEETGNTPGADGSLVAIMTATIMAVRDRPELVD